MAGLASPGAFAVTRTTFTGMADTAVSDGFEFTEMLPLTATGATTTPRTASSPPRASRPSRRPRARS